jgi:cytoskeletal protein CcmA (bactofilin family)
MFKKITYVFVILFAVITFLPSVIFAANGSTPKNVTLAKDQTVNKDYFAAGNNVTLSGTVNGDAYLAGGNITVDGVVNGDLIVAGGFIDIKGKISSNVRAAGGQIIISGQIGRNVSLAAGSISLDNTAKISGSLTAAANTITVNFPVGKDANLAGETISINSALGGNVNVAASQLILSPDAKIPGNLTYWSQNKVEESSGATVSGIITQNVVSTPNVEVEKAKFTGFFKQLSLTLKIISFVSTLIVGLLLIRFFPVSTKKIVNTISVNVWKSMGLGFLTLAAAPLIIFGLMLTVVGIPLAVALIFAILFMGYVAKIFVAMVIGEKLLNLFKRKAEMGWTFAVGLLLYTFLRLIPIIGPIMALVTAFVGIGAVIAEKRNFYLDLRKKDLL